MTQQDKTSVRFWEQKRLSQMTVDEWESLCDGCGRCCLHKLEDEDDSQIYYTRAACALLDIKTCRCMDYQHRQQKMPDCIQLSMDNVEYFNWLPTSCAYRVLAEGEPLPDWHPLISGDPDSVINAGISVRDIAKAGLDINNLVAEVISFIDPLKVNKHDT